MFAHPGTKLIFMGGEFGQTAEWNHDKSLDWYLTGYSFHKGIMLVIQDLNKLYASEPALYRYAFENNGFEWVDYGDRENSVIIFMRKGEKPEDSLVMVCNFTPQPRHAYRVGVPTRGSWKEIFNSDDLKYGGSGLLNQSMMNTSPVKYHSRDYSVTLTLPPLAISVLKLHEEVKEFEIGC